MSRRRASAGFDVALSAVIGVVVLGPVLLRRGYVLRGDLVFVPDMPWKGAWLGLDGRVPRFVPGDAFTATLGHLLPGDLVQKLVLLGIFVVGGAGMGRLTRDHTWWGRAAAITFFLWNPWVLERLAIGQWGIVTGYSFLPWVVLAAERVHDSRRGGWPALSWWLGAAAVFSPASGLVALVVSLAVLLPRPSLRQLGGTLVVGAFVNLPWIVPALLTAPRVRAPSTQFQAFLPHAESSLGAAASVLSLGGIWKSSVVPGERGNALVVAFSLVLTLVAVVGLVSAVRRRTHRDRVLALGVLGLLELLLAVLTTVPVVADHLDGLARAFPPAGLVRDSHRFLGPVALVLSLGLAVAVEAVLRAVAPGREAVRAVAVLLLLAPVLALPSLAWGMGGTWQAVELPREWSTVRQLLPAGRTVVLPWTGGYRGFSWNGRHAGLDPAPRFFPGDVLVDDRIYVGNDVLASEDPLLDDIRRALGSPDPVPGLRRLGVRSVLVEKDGAGEPDLGGATVLHDGPGLRLLDLGPTTVLPAGRPSRTRRDVVVAVDVVVLAGWLLSAGAGTGLALVARRRASTPSTCSVRPHSDTGEGS